MNITKNTLVSDIVTNDFKFTSVLIKYKIDFCCNGNRSLETVCNGENIGVEALIDELQNSVIPVNDTNDYKSWEIDFLSDYIYNTHHKYVETQIPDIKRYLNKICKVHGVEHPELFEINTLFTDSSDDLTMHMKKEELILFPYFKKLAVAIKNGEKIDAAHFGTVKNPIAMMHSEHDNEGERFRKIEALTNNYTPPENACNSYKATFSMLKEFEADLHKHIHLENNILFRKAVDIEQKLMA